MSPLCMHPSLVCSLALVILIFYLILQFYLSEHRTRESVVSKPSSTTSNTEKWPATEKSHITKHTRKSLDSNACKLISSISWILSVTLPTQPMEISLHQPQILLVSYSDVFLSIRSA
jgi:hypothetical protein